MSCVSWSLAREHLELVFEILARVNHKPMQILLTGRRPSTVFARIVIHVIVTVVALLLVDCGR